MPTKDKTKTKTNILEELVYDAIIFRILNNSPIALREMQGLLSKFYKTV